MPKPTFTSSLTQWLKDSGHDRHWLAEQVGATYGTITQWFSKGFPEWAQLSIQRLMNPLGNKASGLELVFNHDEFMEINQAMGIAGYSRHTDFYHDSITQRASEIAKQESSPDGTQTKKIVTFPAPEHTSLNRVAETTAQSTGTDGPPSDSSPAKASYSDAIKRARKRKD